MGNDGLKQVACFFNKKHDEEEEENRKHYEYFWRGNDVFSQWHPSKFHYDGMMFTCAEQYMMYKKAGK